MFSAFQSPPQRVEEKHTRIHQAAVVERNWKGQHVWDPCGLRARRDWKDLAKAASRGISGYIASVKISVGKPSVLTAW